MCNPRAKQKIDGDCDKKNKKVILKITPIVTSYRNVPPVALYNHRVLLYGTQYFSCIGLFSDWLFSTRPADINAFKVNAMLINKLLFKLGVLNVSNFKLIS